MRRPAPMTAALLGLLLSPLFAQNPALPPKLSSEAPCSKCGGYQLAGHLIQSPRADYRIDSDLPEIYTTNGVLYSTAPVLPPMKTMDGVDIPEAMRRQQNAGFTAIDGSFEVFLYHLSQNHAKGETRRIVVYAKNVGTGAAIVAPQQAIFHGPNAGQPGSVESRLGEAVMTEHWQPTAVEPVEIAPGTGAVVGYTKTIGAAEEGPDTSKAVFVTGTVRAAVSGNNPKLQVSVVAIPGDTPRGLFGAAAAMLLGVGAQSGEGNMDMLIPPPECHVRRVVGTAKNMMWQSDPVTLDVATLPAEGIPFQMALPKVQSVGCEAARQTADLLLHPPYVHPDSVGNFQMEYLVTLALANSGKAPHNADLRFGKEDQRVGLAWQLVAASEATPLEALEEQPVSIGWAGKGTEGLVAPAYDASMLKAPLTIAPGAKQVVTVRLMVLGTSSLPYQLWVK